MQNGKTDRTAKLEDGGLSHFDLTFCAGDSLEGHEHDRLVQASQSTKAEPEADQNLAADSQAMHSPSLIVANFVARL